MTFWLNEHLQHLIVACVFSLYASALKQKESETRPVFVLCVYHLTRRVGRRQRSIDAVSQSSDYISSLTAMALSAEGMHWPTLEQLHNPILSPGSLPKNQWNLHVESV